MQFDREVIDAVYRSHFAAFVCRAFEALNPGQRLVENWHIDAVCYSIQQMVLRKSRKKLVLNLPPRSLKSLIVSVCLPAWLLGRNAGARIICASYSQDLADKFSRDCRALIETPFYKRIFPRTRLNPKKNSAVHPWIARQSRPRSTACGRSASTSFARYGGGRFGRRRQAPSPRTSSPASSAGTSRSRLLAGLIQIRSF